jgi:hypothetical protein
MGMRNEHIPLDRARDIQPDLQFGKEETLGLWKDNQCLMNNRTILNEQL